MPRRKSGDFTREIGCDPVYGSELVQKLTNIVMNKCKILYLLNIFNLFCFLKSTNRSIEPNAG